MRSGVGSQNRASGSWNGSAWKPTCSFTSPPSASIQSRRSWNPGQFSSPAYGRLPSRFATRTLQRLPALGRVRATLGGEGEVEGAGGKRQRERIAAHRLVDGPAGVRDLQERTRD